MARAVSAGLLCYRRNLLGEVEVLLAHPGGPFFARKDAGAWTIPKGLAEQGEHLLATARREFAEEIGASVSEDAAFVPLGEIKMKSGKAVHAWGIEHLLKEPLMLPVENAVTIEWPPRSGRQQSFPEIDRAEFFGLSAAAAKIIPAQQPFLDRLREALNGPTFTGGKGVAQAG